MMVRRVWLALIPCLLTGSLMVSCGGSSESDDESSVAPTPTPTATPATTPTPTPTATPEPTPTPTPVPTPVAWVPTAGSLSGGTWQAPAVAPDAAHAGAYGGVTYAPNGDLYLFYQKGSWPNENLYGVIRRNGDTAWTDEAYVGMRERTAHVYFKPSGQPIIATESGSSVSLYTSANYNTPTVTWAMTNYFQASDGNNLGYGVNGDAFLTSDGTNLKLFYTYLHFNIVTGAAPWATEYLSQSAGAWPGDGTAGTIIDNPYWNWVAYENYPRGASGLFRSASGEILALSNIALRSSDDGANFSRVMDTGDKSTGLSGVSGASQHPDDESIVVGNLYESPSGNWHLGVWGTRDYGDTFSKIKQFDSIGTPFKAQVITAQNLIVVTVMTTDGLGGTGPVLLQETHSYDGGTTWTALTTLVDATAGGHPTYTLGSAYLSANESTGSVALAYTLLDGATHKGAYLKEFH